MKRREILKVPVKKPQGKGGKGSAGQITVQTAGGCLILDIWKQGKAVCRHAMNLETGEYGTYDFESKEWSGKNLNNAAEPGKHNCNYYYEEIREKDWPLSGEDRKLLEAATGSAGNYNGVYGSVCRREWEYSSEKNTGKRERKAMRLRELMARFPVPGTGVRDWLARTAAGDLHYAFYDRGSKSFHCTACGEDFKENAGTKLKDGSRTACPGCGAPLTVKKRTDHVRRKTALTVIGNLDEKQGAVRHFRAEIVWRDRRTVELEETIRLLALREGKRACRIYYDDGWGGWSEGNRANRRWQPGYLYPDADGIRAGLEGTAYGVWGGVFPVLAEAGQEADYNGLLVESNEYWARTAEYLFKGRFHRLLTEESLAISYLLGYRGGRIRVKGTTMEEVLGIGDRQVINRLRQENGGAYMLEWLQLSCRTGKKISTECLRWMEKEGIRAGVYEKGRACAHFTPEQLMNYLKRQQAESYGGMKMRGHSVLEQYEDYISMAEELGRDTDDGMVYRPRELKRRHDEAVEEINLRKEELMRKRNRKEAERRAEEMRAKYPGYEELLQEIRQKYEYEDDTYRIIVPKNFMEITEEGMALHHCVGTTERYFDRIVSRETYICFLRLKSAADEPFYTIEVEPGGTIRQHRGAFDEEPGIDEIKPFLRRWQKEIRRRMTREDHVYAAASEVLRRKNIEDLTAAGNSRVLNGLAEDLMEVE